jgi:hypothetical protein
LGAGGGGSAGRRKKNAAGSRADKGLETSFLDEKSAWASRTGSIAASRNAIIIGPRKRLFQNRK